VTTETSSSLVGTAAAAATGAFAGLPNPIAAALYALVAAVVGWVVTWALNVLKKRLGL
jgi:hypothetical protein